MASDVATTQWSEVLAARDGSGTEARDALESLCQTYWQPLYAYVRHQGSDPDEAAELTQAFFTELLDKDWLADVDRDKGRFRSFLLAALRHFLSHQRDRERALKRGGGAPTLSLDARSGEQRYSMHPTETMTPENVYEHRWALAVLDRAMERLGEEARASGSGEQLDVLKQYLTSVEEQVPYRDVALRLGMSEGAVKMAVHRLRKRYGQCLRAEIADTVADSADTDDEVRHLLTIVQH